MIRRCHSMKTFECHLPHKLIFSRFFKRINYQKRKKKEWKKILSISLIYFVLSVFISAFFFFCIFDKRKNLVSIMYVNVTVVVATATTIDDFVTLQVLTSSFHRLPNCSVLPCQLLLYVQLIFHNQLKKDL